MNERLPEGWIMRSFRIHEIKENSLLTYNFQSLGRMDINLSGKWERIKYNLTDPPNILLFDQVAFLSSLWVMGGYEFMRILKGIDKKSQVKDAYELFRRVRVPMVKFESPKNKGKEAYPGDFGIARPSIGIHDKSLGWAVAQDTFISRDQLAQVLYNLY